MQCSVYSREILTALLSIEETYRISRSPGLIVGDRLTSLLNCYVCEPKMRCFRIVVLLSALTVGVCLDLTFAEAPSPRLPVVTFEIGAFAQWKPDPEQIRETEIALRVVFNKATEKLGANPIKPKEFSSYGRQYFGRMNDRLRTIEVIGFCTAFGHSESELSKTPLMVLDGGTCFFRGEYDPDKKIFTSFYFHEEA